MIKRLLFTTCFCLFGSLIISINAQITVDSTDYAGVGDIISRANDSIPPVGISVGGTGQQTWDFTSLQIDYIETLWFIDPASTANGSDFPTSIVAMDDAQQISYHTSSLTQLMTDGFAGDPMGVGTTFSVPYAPVQTVIEFPSTYNDSFNDTSEFDLIIDATTLGLPVPDLDSVRIIHSNYIYSQIDAYGTADLPNESFDCIRQLYTENTIDSIWAYCSNPSGCFAVITTLPFGWSFLPSALTEMVTGGQNPGVDTIFTYKWIANGEDYPVLEMRTNSLGGDVISVSYKIGINITISSTDATCNGICDGDATVFVSGGTPPYTYLWDDPLSQTTVLATGLCSGNNTVIVTDAIGITESDIVTINESDPVTVYVLTNDDTGNCDGDATATETGGTAPYTYQWDDSSSQNTQTATGLCAGTYNVTITDANGCTGIGTTTIDMCTPPVQPVITDSNNCYLTASTISGVSYQWLLNGIPIPGATSQFFTADSIGDYTVIVTDASGCYSSSDTVFAGCVTGIELFPFTNSIQTYPNPTVNELYIIAPSQKEGVVRIYNIIGKRIKNLALEGNITKINTSKLAVGMYIYQVVDAEGNVLKNGKFSVLK
ncbi:MAG: T9SS type A sorting domain-containing protein [Bacteroidota bacterium]